MRKLKIEILSLIEFFVGMIFMLPRTQMFNSIKKLPLGVLGAKIGRNCTFYPGVFISTGKNLKVGDWVDFARGVIVTTSGGVDIGDRTLIGYNTVILSRNHIIPEPPNKIFDSGHVDGPVEIKADVWIGANCTILPGATIGEGCVIAAGSVVRGNCEPFSLYAGVPAKKIKSIH